MRIVIIIILGLQDNILVCDQRLTGYSLAELELGGDRREIKAKGESRCL